MSPEATQNHLLRRLSIADPGVYKRFIKHLQMVRLEPGASLLPARRRNSR